MDEHSETLLTFYQTESNINLAFYTLAIVEEMKNEPLAGQVSTKSILNFMNAGYYQKLKDKILRLQSQKEINLSFEDLGTFCFLIDFSATCLTSSVFYPRLQALHLNRPFDNSVTFEELTSFYVKFAGEFMNYLKSTYIDNPHVMELFTKISSWNRNDNRF